MARRFVLDSDILIHLERGHPVIRERFKAISIDQMATTIINRAELMVGAFYRGVGKKRIAQLNEMFGLITVLPFDEGASLRFAHIKAHLLKTGGIIEDMDLMIAAIAIMHDLTLVTNNMRDFHRVPGLKLESWHH